MTHPIGILIADDYMMVRHTLRQMCTTEPDTAVIGQATNEQKTMKVVPNLALPQGLPANFPNVSMLTFQRSRFSVWL